MPSSKTVAVANSSGRQSASFVRVASAVGWHVRAQMRDREGIVADELSNLPNVTIIEGNLDDQSVIDRLFNLPPSSSSSTTDTKKPAISTKISTTATAPSVDLAFINTTHWGDEVRIGRALAHAAKKARVAHYIYSSMPDHAAFEGHNWRSLPMWSTKFAVENYIRALDMPATFVYCGIYHNNFTSLPYPLFRLELLPPSREGQVQGFEWCAPFHEDDPLPWLDAEHDVGPAVLQLFKEGPRKWVGRRVPLAFSHLTPPQVCAAFSRALSRPVRYRCGPIKIEVPIPSGYAEHLQVLEQTLGRDRAPYFGPELEPGCTKTALELWEGYRGVEEYAREVFPLEEAANGLRWMEEDDGSSNGDIDGSAIEVLAARLERERRKMEKEGKGGHGGGVGGGSTSGGGITTASEFGGSC